MRVNRTILIFLFAVLCLGWLGQRTNRKLEIYTLDERNLIMRHGQERSLALQELVDNQDSTPSEETFRESQERHPASEIAEKLDLGKKRKVKTLLASIDEPRLNTGIEWTALRQRQVSVDSEGLLNMLSDLNERAEDLKSIAAKEKSFELNLFKDANYVAVIDSFSTSLQGGFLIKFHLDNLPNSQFTMIQEGLMVLADIEASAENQFQMRFSEGAHILSQTDPYHLLNASSGPGHSFRTGRAPGKIILAYTPALRSSIGGEAGMYTLAQLALARALSGDSLDIREAFSSLERLQLVELASNDITENSQALFDEAFQLRAEQVHILTQGNTQIVAL